MDVEHHRLFPQQCIHAVDTCRHMQASLHGQVRQGNVVRLGKVVIGNEGSPLLVVWRCRPTKQAADGLQHGECFN